MGVSMSGSGTRALRGGNRHTDKARRQAIPARSQVQRQGTEAQTAKRASAAASGTASAGQQGTRRGKVRHGAIARDTRCVKTVTRGDRAG